MPSKDATEHTLLPMCHQQPSYMPNIGWESPVSPQHRAMGQVMTIEGTRATHKLGAFSTIIQETKLF